MYDPKSKTEHDDPISADAAPEGDALAVTGSGDTYAIPGAPVFCTGDHRGKPYTEADLADIIRNYDLACTGDSPAYRVPVVLGHSEDQAVLKAILSNTDIPAAGWASPQPGALRIADDGTTLLADLEKVHPELARLVKSGGYREISAEIYDEPPEGMPPGCSGKMIRRIAFLGADPPQIKGLGGIPDPVPERYAEAGFPWWRFSERLSPVLLECGHASEVRPGLWAAFSEAWPVPAEIPASGVGAMAPVAGLDDPAAETGLDIERLDEILRTAGLDDATIAAMSPQGKADLVRALDAASENARLEAEAAVTQVGLEPAPEPMPEPVVDEVPPEEEPEQFAEDDNEAIEESRGDYVDNEQSALDDAWADATRNYVRTGLGHAGEPAELKAGRDVTARYQDAMDREIRRRDFAEDDIPFDPHSRREVVVDIANRIRRNDGVGGEAWDNYHVNLHPGFAARLAQEQDALSRMDFPDEDFAESDDPEEAREVERQRLRRLYPHAENARCYGAEEDYQTLRARGGSALNPLDIPERRHGGNAGFHGLTKEQHDQADAAWDAQYAGVEANAVRVGHPEQVSPEVAAGLARQMESWGYGHENRPETTNMAERSRDDEDERQKLRRMYGGNFAEDDQEGDADTAADTPWRARTRLLARESQGSTNSRRRLLERSWDHLDPYFGWRDVEFMDPDHVYAEDETDDIADERYQASRDHAAMLRQGIRDSGDSPHTDDNHAAPALPDPLAHSGLIAAQQQRRDFYRRQARADRAAMHAETGPERMQQLRSRVRFRDDLGNQSRDAMAGMPRAQRGPILESIPRNHHQIAEQLRRTGRAMYGQDAFAEGDEPQRMRQMRQDVDEYEQMGGHYAAAAAAGHGGPEFARNNADLARRRHTSAERIRRTGRAMYGHDAFSESSNPNAGASREDTMTTTRTPARPAAAPARGLVPLEQYIADAVGSAVGQAVAAQQRQAAKHKAEIDAQLSKFSEQALLAEKRKGVEAALDRLIVAEMRVPPAEREEHHAALMNLDASKVVYQYSENGKDNGLTAFDLYLRSLEKRPVMFSEKPGTGGAQVVSGDLPADPEERKLIQHFNEREAAFTASGLSREKVLTAFKAEREKLNPKLTAEQFLCR